MRLHKGVVRVITEPNLWEVAGLPSYYHYHKGYHDATRYITEVGKKYLYSSWHQIFFIKICRFLNYFVLTESLLAMAVL